MAASIVMMLAFLVLISLVKCTFAFQFFLEVRGKKCFHEDIPLGATARLTFTVAQGDGEMPVSLRVMDTTHKVIYQKEPIEHGVFSFRAPETIPGVKEQGNWALRDDEEGEDDEGYFRAMPDGAGDDRVRYFFCFAHSSAMRLPRLGRRVTSKRKVIFRIDSGTNSKTQEDYDKLAKERHLSSSEGLFRVVEDRVSDVVHLIDEMRQREMRMEHLNLNTSRTVTFYCTLSCLCIALGALYSSHATFRQFSMKRAA